MSFWQAYLVAFCAKALHGCKASQQDSVEIDIRGVRILQWSAVFSCFSLISPPLQFFWCAHGVRLYDLMRLAAG